MRVFLLTVGLSLGIVAVFALVLAWWKFWFWLAPNPDAALVFGMAPIVIGFSFAIARTSVGAK